jgi:hypothetical protein
MEIATPVNMLPQSVFLEHAWGIRNWVRPVLIVVTAKTTYTVRMAPDNIRKAMGRVAALRMIAI